MWRVGFGVRFRDQGRSCSCFPTATEDIVFAHPHVGLRLGTAPVPLTTESGPPSWTSVPRPAPPHSLTKNNKVNLDKVQGNRKITKLQRNKRKDE
ncbi:Desmoglein-1 [Manis javanica]|nr:Desmoglein-1 [Manis javanica]